MSSKNLFFPILFAVLLSSCNNTCDNKITNSSDYDVYLNTESNPDKITALQELEFWNNKLIKTPGQHPYLIKLASNNTRLFNITGDIDYLISAENNIVDANVITNNLNAGYLRSLAKNYVSQHRFKEALQLLLTAEKNGENLQNTRKMLFDVHLELGNYVEAKNYLEQFASLSDFDYLIRLSKWNDHQGKLDAAINYMEKASRMAEKWNNEGLMQWSYTNLADFYGHANRISDSYNYYLKSLELNPNDSYSLKGISWIVYSHERNTDEASRILDSIIKRHESPDYHLLKAEIAEFKNDISNKELSLKQYWAAADNPMYGVMYNKYNVIMLLEEKNNIKEAFVLAHNELIGRPTPQSYDLLAWAYFKSGNKKEALKIIEQNIDGKTHEPEVQYHMAEIYKANGKKSHALSIKDELLSSAYELGPLLEQKIKLL